MSLGLLDKSDPHATPRSVVICALKGSVRGGVFAAIASWWKDFESSLTLLMVVFLAVMGAGVGAIFEWQWHNDLQDLRDD